MCDLVTFSNSSPWSMTLDVTQDLSSYLGESLRFAIYTWNTAYGNEQNSLIASNRSHAIEVLFLSCDGFTVEFEGSWAYSHTHTLGETQNVSITLPTVSPDDTCLTSIVYKLKHKDLDNNWHTTTDDAQFDAFAQLTGVSTQIDLQF